MTGKTWKLSGFGDEISADPALQLAVLQALGASHIEVRSVWETNVVDLSDDQLDDFSALLASSGFQVSAIASPVGKVDVELPTEHELARLRRAIQAAHRLGTKYIRLFSFYRAEGVPVADIRDAVLERMRAFAELAETEDVVLLHENEKDIYGDTPERVLDIVESVASPRLRVAWDSANFVQVGVRPFSDGYAALRPYLEYLQVKDALAATGEVVVAGAGDGEVRATIEALRDDGYMGYVSLEPHLAEQSQTGGFSGAFAFGAAARALRTLTDDAGIVLV